MSSKRLGRLSARVAAVATITMALAAQTAMPGGAPVAEAHAAPAQSAVVVRDNTWHLRETLSGGPADVVFSYGRASDQPLLGDWTGDDQATPGVVRGSTFHLKHDLGGGAADRSFTFGRADDEPLVGDWNGDGHETVGVRRGNTFYLRNRHSGGAADISFRFGRADDEPLVGDWNGDGRDTIGVRRGNTFYLKDAHSGGAADRSFSFGRASDQPVSGDWNGDGRDTVGVVRGSTFYLRHEHGGGAADEAFAYGASSDEPLVWSEVPAATTSDPDPSTFKTSLETWDALAECESNGVWSLNTGNGYYGGLQFNKGSWDAAGGERYAEWPHQASRLEQIAIGERWRDLHPYGWGAWPYCSDLLGLS